MEEYNDKFARMSNHSFIKEIDQAAAILDDELKAISEVENTVHNTSVYADEDFFQDDDDDLTGELANLESLGALQDELNMSALSFEEFNANNLSRASMCANNVLEDEDAVITDVGEIRIGDTIDLEDGTPWKRPLSPSQEQVEETMPWDSLNVRDIQTSNDSEDSSFFQTSSHDSSSVVPLMSQDRLDIALSPIRFHSETDERNRAPPSQPRPTREPSMTTPAREILVDTTKSSANVMDSQQSEDATPKIQNTRTFSNVFQFQDDENRHSKDENGDDLQGCKPTPKKEEDIGATSTATPSSQQPVDAEESQSPMSLLNALLSSPETFFSFQNLGRVVSEEEPLETQAVATSESEGSTAGETHSFSSQASSAEASLSSASSISASSAVSSTSKSSTQSTDKKKWNPTRLFKQKNTSEESQRKSIFSKPSSKRKKSKSKIRLLSSQSPTLPTVSEDVTLPTTQPEVSSATIPQLQSHDPSEKEIRQTLGMEEDSTSTDSGTRMPLFKDNKERIAANRMMKMLMEQRNKNKTQERRERKLLHMLCDARNDRMQLISEHEKELEDLERKMRSSVENNEILRQENELLIMQTEAWKEISRQSNQTAALYKYTFDGRQGQGLYHAPVRESINGRSTEMAKGQYEDELAQALKEKEELEEKLEQFQKDSHLELEDVKYKATWIQRELEQSRTLFEDKLATYMQDNLRLKEETASLRNQLEQSHSQVTTGRMELEDLKDKLESKRLGMHKEIVNLRVHKLEEQLIQLQDNHKNEVSNSIVDMAVLQARLKSLETSLDQSNDERYKIEGDLKSLQEQLSRERRSRTTSTRIFQQQNESLVQVNESLQENVKKMEEELEKCRSDYERIQEELVNERNEVHRLEKQAEDDSQMIVELQEELDSLQAKLEEAETQSPPKSARSPQCELSEAQGTLEQEIQAAENVALRAQVQRLKQQMKSISPSTPSSSSYSSAYKSPVEKRVRDQVLRLRNSLQQVKQKEGEEENVVPPPASPFFSDSPSVTLTGNFVSSSQKSTASTSPKKFVSMLRPKAAKGQSMMQPRRLDKENNSSSTFMSPKQRRGVGLSARTGLGIR